MKGQEPRQGGGARGGFQRSVRQSGKDRHRSCSLAPSQAFCLPGDCLLSFLGASDFLMDQTSLLGSWVQPVCRDMPSPSHGVHVSIPTALADAKTFLTLPVLSPLVTAVFGSRPFPHRLVSSRLLQTCGTGLCTSLGTGCSPPTLQRPICTTNQTSLPTTLQPLCTV